LTVLRLRSSEAGQARTWSSGFLSIGYVVFLQNVLPLCEFCDIMYLPDNHQSGGKRYSGPTPKGNNALTTTMVAAAWTAVRTKDTFLKAR
jgi:hypothetical protein